MLKKYQNFVKLSKTKQCNLYEANLRQDMNKVLLKRLKSAWSWNQMLRSHALKLQSAQNFTPKVLQIFKHNGSYFVVYERPNGSSLRCFDESIKLEIDDFYVICSELVNYVDKLKQQIVNLYIYPEWIFLHRNGIKICHFEPYFQEKNDKNEQQNHVFIYDMLNGNIDSKKIRESQQPKGKRIKNLNFNLGYIAYHILTGKTTQWKQDEQDYESVIKQIRQNAEVKLMKQVNDKVLTSLIVKLLNRIDDPLTFDQTALQNDLFDEFKSYLKRKTIECRNCKVKRESFRIVQFSLQKLKLQKQIPKIKTEKKKKCFRPCCCKTFEDEPNPEQQDHKSNRYQIVHKTQQVQKVALGRAIKLKTQNSQSPSQIKLKERTFSNLKTTHRYRINTSSVLPSLGTQRRHSTQFSNAKNFISRETMFKKSMNAAQIARTYLKTEY